MKNKIKLFLNLWVMLFTFLNVNAQCETIKNFFKNDMYTSKELVAFAEKDPQKAYDSWKILYNEKAGLTRSVEELNLVSKNLDKIGKAGGYLKWKALQGIGNITNDFANLLNSKGYSYLKNQFTSLDEVAKNKFMRNFPEETPSNILSALNDPNKGLLKKWKEGTIKGNPEGFDRYYYQSKDPLTHSDIGDFANPHNPNTSLESGKMTGGGHGQSNIDYLKSTGKQHNIEHTFDNGVRTGNIPDHKVTAKTQGIGQSWFPSNWTKQDIDTAAKHVIQQNQSTYNSLADGVPLFDTYNGVRVGLIKTNGQFATIFPDNKFQPNSAGQLILNPKF